MKTMFDDAREAAERVWLGLPDSGERLIANFRRNPPGSAARWEALGECCRQAGESDKPSVRSALAFQVEQYGMRR